MPVLFSITSPNLTCQPNGGSWGDCATAGYDCRGSTGRAWQGARASISSAGTCAPDAARERGNALPAKHLGGRSRQARCSSRRTCLPPGIAVTRPAGRPRCLSEKRTKTGQTALDPVLRLRYLSAPFHSVRRNLIASLVRSAFFAGEGEGSLPWARPNGRPQVRTCRFGPPGAIALVPHANPLTQDAGQRGHGPTHVRDCAATVGR